MGAGKRKELYFMENDHMEVNQDMNYRKSGYRKTITGFSGPSLRANIQATTFGGGGCSFLWSLA